MRERIVRTALRPNCGRDVSSIRLGGGQFLYSLFQFRDGFLIKTPPSFVAFVPGLLLRQLQYLRLGGAHDTQILQRLRIGLGSRSQLAFDVPCGRHDLLLQLQQLGTARALALLLRVILPILLLKRPDASKHQIPVSAPGLARPIQILGPKKPADRIANLHAPFL